MNTQTKLISVFAIFVTCINSGIGFKVQSNYKTTGYETRIGEGEEAVDVYISLPSDEAKDDDRIVFVVHDAFGYHPNNNIRQIADLFSQATNIRVVLPDFFRGPGWPITDWPLNDQNKPAFQEFMSKNGSWDQVETDLKHLIKYFKTEEGTKHFGIFGFCWGGRIALLASSEIGEIKVTALIHPAGLNYAKDPQIAKAPMLLLPSKDEPVADMEKFYKLLVAKFGRKNVGYHHFINMPHGFAGARGNFDDPLNQKEVDQVIDILARFFTVYMH